MTDAAGSTLYVPTDTVVVRAPLLPAGRHRDVTGPNPLVRNAIHAASSSLGRALDAATPGLLPDAVAAAERRYRIRMSTRPTPYGLFAAVGLAGWGPVTDLRIADDPRPRRTRPDMGWLAGWVLALEADPAVRAHARLVTNTSAFERAGRIHLSDRGTGGRAGLPDVSVRATGAVRRALALARRPIEHATLCDELLARTDGATPERVEGLVDDLCRADLLLADLRPPLTGDPVREVHDRLAALPATRVRAAALAEVLAQLRALDRTALDDDHPAALARARGMLRALHAPPDADADVVQVDAALPLLGATISRCVAQDAAQAMELLLSMHPAPGGPAHLAAYRADFLARYGHDRWVPLLELLDPRFGLGLPGGPGGSGRAGGPHARERDALLLELAAEALRDGATEITPSDAELGVLRTWTPDPRRLPPSLELSVFVAAADRAALDRGDYRLAVGPNLGGQAAGRGLGRFADLLGDRARALLTEIAAAEEALGADPAGDAAVTAELVYLPVRHRAANVTVRPAVRRYEIPVGVAPGVPTDRVIAPDRLAVGVRDGRLRLWWADGDREVTVAAGHMLNAHGAPAVCRFLTEIGQDGVTGLTGFGWGPAAGLPFLPRVRVGRIVLRPAQWQWPRERLRSALRTDDGAAFDRALEGWRDRWRVPRQVYLAAGDNRLLLDLDDPAHAGLLRADVRRRGGTLLLQEGLPSTGDAWLPGPGGQYISELVVPMVLRRVGRPAASRRPVPAATAGGTEGRARVAVRPVPQDEADRLRPPGSDWLYVKLYGTVAGADDLVTGPMRRLTAELVAAGHADGWFFLRYADPDPHVRLRLHGPPDRLLTQALPRLATWAAGLVASGLRSRFTIESYERELERYGGPAVTALAEAVFMADSVAVGGLLAVLDRACGPGDGDAGTARVDVAVLSTDTLLRALGLDAAARLAWCSDVAPAPRESGAAFRERKERLRGLLAGPPDPLLEPPLRRLVDDVTPVAQELARLHTCRSTAEWQTGIPDTGGPTTGLQPSGPATAGPDTAGLKLETGGPGVLAVTDLARSLVHVHANRLGLDREAERLVLGLLRRTLASLAIAPHLPRSRVVDREGGVHRPSGR